MALGQQSVRYTITPPVDAIPMPMRYWELLVARIRGRLAGYPQEQLLEWAYQLNRWYWPTTLPIPRPFGLIDGPMYGDEKYILLAPAYRVLCEMTTQEERSQFLWTKYLGHTQEEWRVWWDEEGRAFQEEIEKVLVAAREGSHGAYSLR